MTTISVPFLHDSTSGTRTEGVLILPAEATLLDALNELRRRVLKTGYMLVWLDGEPVRFSEEARHKKLANGITLQVKVAPKWN